MMAIRSGGGNSNDRFERIYRQWYPRVWRWYVSCRVSDSEAHDLAQDAFKRLFERMHQIRNADEWPFLQSIARSVLLNWLRARRTAKRHGNLVDIDAPEVSEKLRAAEEPDYAERQQTEQRSERLRSAIAELPDSQKQTIQLRLADLSYEEIGRALRITPDAVKSRLRDAKRTLRARLGDVQGLPEDDE